MEAEVNKGYWSVEPATPAESNVSCSLDSRLAFNSQPDSCASTVLTGESEDEDIFSAEDHFVSLQQPPKDPRSKAKYNIFSRLFFFWLEPLFYLGAHRELQQEDLYAHPLEADSELLLAKFNWYWKRELRRKLYGRYPRLWVALCKCILWRFILQGLLILIEAGILLSQSVVLGYLTEYFNIEDPTPQDTRNAYLYAFGLVMLSLVVIVMHSHSFLMGQKMSMMLRITSTAAIFEKVLSLTQGSISRLSVGHVVNLASNDVQRFDPVFPHFPYIWVSPIHLIVFTYLAFQEVGWTAFLASGFIILQVPLQVLFARLFVKFRFKSASLTDKRINIMSEVLTGIRVIKMYTWEYAFKDIVSKLRKNESSIVFKGAIIRACNLAYMIVSTSIIMWLVLTVRTSTGGDLSTRQVFTLLSLLTTLRLSSYFFVLALLGFSEGKVAIQRIQNFLEQDNGALPELGNSPSSKFSLLSRKKSKGCVYPVISNYHSADKIKLSATCYTDSVIIKVTNMSASWSYNREKTVLENISFEVNESIPLLAVIGPVGSGKSSLIHCLLGELKALDGTVTVKGSISYVSQEPWIFAGTVRDNILFGEKFDKIWYERVLEACSLDEDIRQLPERDFTLVGERGVTLSGGQKARVNLARAIYRDSQVYLLDDPFSALDVNVAMHIYDNCLRGLLEDRLVVLVTHQIQFALPADKILLIKHGRQEVYSSNEELLAQGLDPAHLIGLIHEDDEDGDENERNMFSYKNSFEPPSPTTVSMLSTDQIVEDGHITPFSFTSSVYNGNFETRSPVMTPLALFSKSMRDMQLHTSTSIIPRRKRPEVFVFPIAEGDEPDAVAKLPLPRIVTGSPSHSDNSAEHLNNLSNSPILGSKPELEISHPAWPFATTPPDNSTALNAEEHTEEFAESSPHNAWPFAKTSGVTSETKQSDPMPVHEVWPVAINPPAKTQFANGKVLPPSSGATAPSSEFVKKSPISFPTSLVKEQPWPFAGKPPAATSSLSHTTIADAKANATNQLQLSSEDDQGHNPTAHLTINLLPPTPPLVLEHSNPKKSVHISKVKPSPLTLSANSQSVNHSNPPHGMVTTKSPHTRSKSPINNPRFAKKTPSSPAPLQPSANHFTVLWKTSHSPTPSLPITPLHSKTNIIRSPVSGRKASPSPILTSYSPVQGRKAPVLSIPKKVPINLALSPPISPRYFKKNPLVSPSHERRAPLSSVGRTSSPLHVIITPPTSPHYSKTTPLSSPSLSGRPFSSPPRFKGTPLLSPVHASFKKSPIPSRGRTPFTSPLPARSKSAMDDEVHTVSLEPGRFDAASIYSARSVMSIASVVAKKITTTNLAAEEKSLAETEPEQTSQEGKRMGTVSLRTYCDFFKAGGGILLVTIALLLFILGEVGIVVSDWWLSDWANCFSTASSSLLANESSGNSSCNLNSDLRISVYTATTFSATILSFGRAIFFCFLCINASRVLHNHMFDTILRAKILFFDTNPIGKILNRFSKDIGFLDDLLPYTFCEFILLFLRCLAVMITAAASNAWLLIPAFFIIIVFILLRWYYLKSARDVKRLEAIARSPVYSHLSTTLQGLSTIRSYQRATVALRQLHEVQNQHSQGWYLYLVMVRWFGLRIDMLSVLFLASVAFLSIPLSSQLNAGLVGLSLTYTISLADMLQYMIRLSAEVENTMISAERVIEYGKLDPETLSSTAERTSEDWPTEGEVKMDDVMFQYAADAPMVLQNLSFTIKKGEKVGIVGRTGAGKSSLIAVLYRLAEPNGQITIDGVETKSIGLHDLRKKMSIIPQDPVLFSGSMRYNLDPFEKHSDAELWEVLEQVQLKAAVEELEGQLSGEVSEGGSNFSVGQRQLVCLARALLRKNKILILDEATANVDPRTDGIIQKAIHETFANCTTLVIAHRLDTIMDSDKILLLKNGRVKEFDSPYRLLQNPSSKFYLMVEKTGVTASGRLHQMALESHLRRMFKKNGRITPAQSRVGVKKMSSLFAQSLLQRSTGSGPFGLSRLQERRASILSSNSFPRALNELGIGGPGIVNSNDPNLCSLRLPSDSHLPKESN